MTPHTSLALHEADRAYNRARISPSVAAIEAAFPKVRGCPPAELRRLQARHDRLLSGRPEPRGLLS